MKYQVEGVKTKADKGPRTTTDYRRLLYRVVIDKDPTSIMEAKGLFWGKCPRCTIPFPKNQAHQVFCTKACADAFGTKRRRMARAAA